MDPWRAWTLDLPTWGWIGWIAYFALLEGWAILADRPVHTLTFHLRPLFLETPVTWWLTLGLWLWLGVHMLAPTLEAWIVTAARGPQ
jgi:hypothetical protein